MKNATAQKGVLYSEIIAIVFINLVVWLDEIIDLPHLIFNAAPTPINYVECVLE